MAEATWSAVLADAMPVLRQPWAVHQARGRAYNQLWLASRRRTSRCLSAGPCGERVEKEVAQQLCRGQLLLSAMRVQGLKTGVDAPGWHPGPPGACKLDTH